MDQGGGFYGGETQGQNTPSTGEKRRQRAQNLVPVQISEILDSREETFKVEGMEVGMVTIVGIVDGVDHQVGCCLRPSRPSLISSSYLNPALYWVIYFLTYMLLLWRIVNFLSISFVYGFVRS